MPRSPVEPVVLTDAGLGNSTYLVDLGDGGALVVDPARDLRAVRAAAAARGLRVRFAADTHLHADFLSGSLQLAADRGSDAVAATVEVLASAAGHRCWPHRALVDGDELDLGGLRLRAWATPGHTDEHLAFVLLDGDLPVGVFSGGSLLVGSAARTDLIDPKRTEELARSQYRSVQRLLELPDEVAVWPTHGAGSFCSAPAGASRTSSIGAQRTANPLLQTASEDEFVAALLASLGTYPTYFDRLGEVNRRGPALLDELRLPSLPGPDVQLLQDQGAVVVDVRPAASFAAGHVPGSVSIPLRPAFATWLGWVVPPDRPVVVVRDPDQDLDDVVWPAANIGYDHLVGELAGGMGGWTDQVATIGLAEPSGLTGQRMLDVRQAAEYADGHVPGAAHRELGTLARLPDDAAAAAAGTVVMCGHGERAMTAASLLQRGGARDMAVLIGGADDWATVTGEDLATGPAEPTR